MALLPTTHYMQADGFGSTRWLTDSAGSVTDSIDYDAFGVEIARSGTTEIEHLYRGERWDANVAAYDLRARLYTPGNGRFLTQDSFAGFSMDPPSLHKYTFNHNNPINRVDPSGNKSLIEVGVALNVVGIGVNIATYAVNIATGNYVGLAENVVEDVASTLIPGGAIAKNAKRVAQWFMRGKTFIVGAKASSHYLRHNMVQLGINPCSGCAAHHLIPGSDNRFPAAVDARKILEANKVDINSFVNGVFLPTRKSAPPDLFPSSPHVAGHSEAYYKDVLETLRAYGADRPRNKDGLYSALKDIQQRLLSGELRINDVDL